MKTIEREGEELKVEQRIAERFSEEEGFKAPREAPKGGKDTGLVGWEDALEPEPDLPMSEKSLMFYARARYFVTGW